MIKPKIIEILEVNKISNRIKSLNNFIINSQEFNASKYNDMGESNLNYQLSSIIPISNGWTAGPFPA